ncbi:hypothetical protein PTSG_05800 [Salpingoeca rosetta]|uniref:Uncharacterized protein n=1 Tax=Salpingoeca rosetta (strain ATCC 50818 / BSB-021) TaxID=946362 RepID=F2UCU0_SALR5|nr:uncharacterized protein PTSG_05800 [Salpingoeca rosetta]EGD74435.1 hypothetical protein PTSG_05800 [Salpingoeca rosetta]|eukprot:XP_004992692.1 hypothetical protein PTSG_05800 [Salpingoeca rosetta]
MQRSSSSGASSLPLEGVVAVAQLPQAQRNALVAISSHGKGTEALSLLDIETQSERGVPFSSKLASPTLSLSCQQSIPLAPLHVTGLNSEAVVDDVFEEAATMTPPPAHATDRAEERQPVSGLSVLSGGDGRFCSTTEDGLLHVWDAAAPARVGSWGRPKALRCSMLSCVAQTHKDVVVGTNVGAVEIWDTHAPTADSKSGSSAALTFTSEPSEDGSLQMFHSIAVHPSERNIIVAGGHDGLLVFWDARQPLVPLATIQAHTGPVWDISFAPRNPHVLVTAGEDGSVLHWNTNPRQAAARTSFNISTDSGELVVTDMAAHAVGSVSRAVVVDRTVVYSRYHHQLTALNLP